ncbi:hypothetical protein QYF36_026223 [Acer negundo]|nr:hypothetical protein QYF36_026223 [Acer negundo]
MDVISSLATKSSHITYRNSKLTRLLQDSFGGDSKTLMFLQISLSKEDISETLSSLNFTTKVRGVELGPAKRHTDTGEIQKLKLMLEKTKQELRSKDDALQKLEENVLNLETKVRELENRVKERKQAEYVTQHKVPTKNVKELENTLKERTREFEVHLRILQQKIVELELKLRQQ